METIVAANFVRVEHAADASLWWGAPLKPLVDPSFIEKLGFDQSNPLDDVFADVNDEIVYLINSLVKLGYAEKRGSLWNSSIVVVPTQKGINWLVTGDEGGVEDASEEPKRSLDLPLDTEQIRQTDDKVTILFIAADPVDAPNPTSFDRELRDMQDALRGSEFGRRFNLEVKLAARDSDLHRTVRETKPTIVHFAGHGETDGIILEDEDTRLGRIVPVAALAQFFTFYPSVQCVVFNACYTEELAEAVSQIVPYVIGMRTKANDKGSVKFAVAFYDAIGGAVTADPYHKAYEIACNQLLMGGLLETVQPTIKWGHKPIVPHPPA